MEIAGGHIGKKVNLPTHPVLHHQHNGGGGFFLRLAGRTCWDARSRFPDAQVGVTITSSFSPVALNPALQVGGQETETKKPQSDRSPFFYCNCLSLHPSIAQAVTYVSTRLAVDAPDQASCKVLAPNPGACCLGDGGGVITTPPSESLDFGSDGPPNSLRN